MNNKLEKKSYTPIKCKCEPRAVQRPPSLLRRVKCPDCGKIHLTNTESDLCFDCAK